MSECYIIPVGGTGIRIMKSIVNLCMAGCFDRNQTFKVMCVDSDDINGNVKELSDLIGCYKKVGGGMFPEIELNVINGVEKSVWSPLSEDEKDKHSSMREMVAQSSMSDDARDVFQVLYTEPERNKVLEGGFYGHTSIGSYFMAQEVVKDGKFTKVWSDFFGGSGDDKRGANVFMIGSVFGGTGASGVPTIAKLIRDQYAEVNIGALLVMPYFTPHRESDTDISANLGIDGKSFVAKTKTALKFYEEQNFKEIFNEMYFIGEKGKLLNVSYHDSGDKQKNKATAMEVFAATALLDFLKSSEQDGEDKSGMSVKFFWKDIKEGENTAVVTGETLDSAKKGMFKNMFDFLRFSVLYTKYLFPCIEQNYPKKCVAGYRTEDNMESHIALNEVCKKYIMWITDVILENDGNGRLNKDKENSSIRWFNYKDIAEIYNCCELPFDIEQKRTDGWFSDKKDKKVFKVEKGKEEILEKMSQMVQGKSCADGNMIVRQFWNTNPRKSGSAILSLYEDITKIANECDTKH